MRKVLNPDTPTGKRILEVASDLFYERGIRAVGVDLIALEADTTKKTIYDRFGSKDGLVAAYLTRRGELWHAFVEDWLAERAPEPGVERVLAVIDAEEAWRAGSARGCAYINAYAEIGNGEHPGAAVVRAGKTRARELFVSLVREAGGVDPEDVGAAVHLVYEGTLVAAAAGGIATAYDEARRAIRALLDDRSSPD
jgi:AcrR family transcriptional regulator